MRLCTLYVYMYVHGACVGLSVCQYVCINYACMYVWMNVYA